MNNEEMEAAIKVLRRAHQIIEPGRRYGNLAGDHIESDDVRADLATVERLLKRDLSPTPRAGEGR